MTLVLLLVLHFSFTNGFFKVGMDSYPKITSYNDGGDPGNPLFLTPYIESGKIEEGRSLSRVHFPGFPCVKSYSGFLTVDKKYNSNHFFWYFPAECTDTDKKDSERRFLKPALYIWLQGGPGASSLNGLFEENGVFKVENGTLKKRPVYWSYNDHVLYIDNPVGAGFSFTNDSRGHCSNQTQIAEHLYTTLLQFLQLFPELQNLDLFIAGESYAGKYVPALGYYIHNKNPTAKIKVNLKGMMIGDGWSDPINQLDYGSYLYEAGLIDSRQKNEAEVQEKKIKELIENEKWKEANEGLGDLYAFLLVSMGWISIYNYMDMNEHLSDCSYCKLIQTTDIRKSIHVGNLGYEHDKTVGEFLEEDIMQSVAPWISELLENYPILFYNGQYDVICAYPLTTNFLRKLKFSGSDDYLKAERDHIFHEYNGKQYLVGYMKNAKKKVGEDWVFGNLMEGFIRGAGHMVPSDQPEHIDLLIRIWRQRFI